MDAFSKYIQIYPIKKADIRTTIKKLFDNYIPKLGKPRAIQTDHGTQFTAKRWSTKLRENNIISTFSSIRHPQSNIVERVNKEIGCFFRTLISSNHKGWAIWVPFIEECLNKVYHETTEFTPIELQLDIKPTRFWKKWLAPCDRNDIPYETKIALAKDRIKRKGQARADHINKKTA